MMATPTYDLIEEQILGSAQATVTFGTGGTLTQAYKDLVLECVPTGSGGAVYVALQFNGDTGANYSRTTVDGNGTSATSLRQTGLTYAYATSGSSASGIHTAYCQVMSYANSSTYKTMLSRFGDNTAGGSYVNAVINLWRSTSAITSITVNAVTNSYATGSTFRLWGVKG